MKLNHQDKTSGTWLRLKEHYEARLAILRAKNDGDLTDLQTAALRGEIRMVKQFIELGEDLPQVAADD